MRILFLSHHFRPEVNAPAWRTYDHCLHWARDGHEVTVVTCTPNHPNGRPYPGYRNRFWQTEVLDGIRVIRVWTFLAANRGVMLRTLNHLSYLFMATLVAPWLPRADVVISTSPPLFCGLAGYGVSRIKGARWVLEVRDLWPEAIRAVGAISNLWLIRLLEAIEGWAYRRADRVVTVTRSFAAHIVGRSVPEERIAVITNGVNLELFQSPYRDPKLEEELGLQGKFVVGYFGTLGMAHRLETLLDAAEMLRDEPEIRILIVGDGAERDRLRNMRGQRGLDNVIMLDQQAKEQMPRFWGVADVSLATMRKAPLFTTMIPAKMFEAMAMERPVILGFEGESREIVEGAGCGIAVEPENAAEMAAAIRYLAAHRDEARRMGERGHTLVREKYDRRKLAERFATLLHELVSGEQSSYAGAKMPSGRIPP
jgi:glycosyltransferase involved in cell wall biosynthesis